MSQLNLTVFNYLMQSCKNMFFLCWLWHHRYIIEDKVYFNYDGSLPPWEYTSIKRPLTEKEKPWIQKNIMGELWENILSQVISLVIQHEEFKVMVANERAMQWMGPIASQQYSNLWGDEVIDLTADSVYLKRSTILIYIIL